MSKKTAASQGRRINLDDGYVVMERMTIRQFRALANANEDFDAAVEAVLTGCTEAKFKNGKSLEDQPVAVLTAILRDWNKSEDEVALPPANAPPSPLPSTGT